MKKDFSNSFAETLNVLSNGNITETEPVPEKKSKVKILLRMDPDVHAALQKKARKIMAEENRNYSLTELINDILTAYLNE